MIVEAAQAGHSITGFAGSLGVSRSTLTNWMNEFPEFMAAAEASKSVQSYAWERKAIRVGDTGGGPGTATIITFMLKNLAPEQYAEKKTLEHVGANGGPIQSAQMDPDQFEAIARKIADEI